MTATGMTKRASDSPMVCGIRIRSVLQNVGNGAGTAEPRRAPPSTRRKDYCGGRRSGSLWGRPGGTGNAKTSLDSNSRACQPERAKNLEPLQVTLGTNRYCLNFLSDPVTK